MPYSPHTAARSASTPPSLAGAPWLARAETQAVLAALAAAGHEGRVVGGAVRNALMGLAVSDIDIATPAVPEDVVRAAEARGLHVVPTGLQHGTVTIVCNHIPHEVTTLRHDVETDGRHAKVAFTRDWTADASRRDFTINALYCGADGTVYDPLNAYADIVARRVRFIGSADQRIAEDYLRILRFFRFHAQYGDGVPDPQGVAACVRGRHGLARLSAERIRTELLKLAVAPGVCAALQTMNDQGLLVPMIGGVPRLLPFERLIAIEATTEAARDPVRRLGCLALHVSEDAARLSDRLRLSNEERDLLHSLTEPLSIALSPRLPTDTVKALLYRMGTRYWRDMVMVRWAWSGTPETDDGWRDLLDMPQHWPPPVLPVKGADLVALGLDPGPRIGSLLRLLENDWIAAGFQEDRAALLTRAIRMVNEEE